MDRPRHWTLTAAAALLVPLTACASHAPSPAAQGEDGPVGDASVEEAAEGHPRTTEPEAPPDPPIPPPAANEEGCVPYPTFERYTSELAAHGERALEQAAEEQGARLVERAGFFVGDSQPAQIGHEYGAGGKRFAVVAIMDRAQRPVVTLGERGDTLHVLEPRARSHRLELRVCGANRCPVGRGARVDPQPVAIRLEKGKRLGEPLALEYDTWWVFPAYTRQRRCPAPPP